MAALLQVAAEAPPASFQEGEVDQGAVVVLLEEAGGQGGEGAEDRLKRRNFKS